MCHTVFLVTDWQKKKRLRDFGVAYCSPECRREFQSQNMAAMRASKGAFGNEESARRMRERNPMSDPATRERMSRTLRELGHRPPVRGGNGSGMTEPQRLLLSELGEGWLPELSLGTGKGARARGLPNRYTLDIAHPDRKIAVEVDGRSHRSRARRESDSRKDAWLRSEGWTVFRFSNEDVMRSTTESAQTVLSTT